MLRFILLLYRFCNRIYYDPKNNNIGNKLILKVVYGLYSTLLNIVYGGFLPYKANIPRSVIFIHSLYGVFISEGAVIGEFCTIYHHVTIGSKINKISKNITSPKIGNNVLIGANACVIGSTVIGDNVSVGAGCTIVDTKVADNTIVVNAKNRVIKKQ